MCSDLCRACTKKHKLAGDASRKNISNSQEPDPHREGVGKKKNHRPSFETSGANAWTTKHQEFLQSNKLTFKNLVVILENVVLQPQAQSLRGDYVDVTPP